MRWLLFLFLLSGCCSMCPPKIVYVAAECPVPAQTPIAPSYRTDNLAESATYKETIEAYVLDLEVCDTHAIKLENLLDAYGASYAQYKLRNPVAPK